MVDVPAYALLPGDILGGQPIAYVQIAVPSPTHTNGEVHVEMCDGRILRLPDANEPVRLHARPAYTGFCCPN